MITDQLEAKYGFAEKLSRLSDTEIVDSFNAQVGNRGWGNARAYFLHCLRTELSRRSFDSTCILDNGGLQLGRTVRLSNDKLQITKRRTTEENE